MLNGEENVSKAAYITALAEYARYRLIGKRGVGGASGMFLIEGNDYDDDMLLIL